MTDKTLPRHSGRCLRYALLSLAALTSTVGHAGEVEVLHYWTSGGEAKSLAELKGMMTNRGHSWKDFTVTGGGGQNAMAVLKQRVLGGSAPAAALIKGPTIQEWAELNVLTNLDAMAAFEKWDELLPKVIADQMKHKGRYVAVPVNVHRVNWLWANSAVLRKAGVTTLPSTYEEFFAAADKIKTAGYIAVAHGGQDWQDFTVFESVVLGVGGAGFYNSALVQLDKRALASETMRQSLDVFRRIKSYVDDKASGRDWNVATDMVIKGKAGFQFMGDWAKGEFLAAGQQPGVDFSCSAAPGTDKTYTFNVDSFAMFQLKAWEAQKAQGYLAYLLMGQDFQEKFNLRKGSIPARLHMDMEKFDACAKASSKDFVAASKAATLVPSVAHGMAVSTAAQGALRAVVSEFWNNDQTTVSDTMAKLVLATGTRPR
ncbi:carbohydrate ABC transporter substrate-binding protein [Rhodoferax sp. AJA081-3]|uniref:ABC transporter substrate-binding protein n=1 Tax=Rhodoferax sp. AJA081-3 TaxID=2752316 RepID=UPI001ADFCF29|nr:ABC transporter substrate-binding protein [Rhodoferax sp. AJA081-3]QTN28168.1 carbohydrate ABC transporter substrate-binding protein [Rhodoferax sp. AJA081-3]